MVNIIFLIVLLVLPTFLIILGVSIHKKSLVKKSREEASQLHIWLIISQIITILICYVIGDHYFHQCSMCNGDKLFLLLTTCTSLILLVTLSVNITISHRVRYPALSTLLNFAILIPYYGLSIVAIITTYAIAVEPIFH